MQLILAVCARSAQRCQLQLLLILHDHAPGLLPANGACITACTNWAMQSDEVHIGTPKSVDPSIPLKWMDEWTCRQTADC